jgi:hypothetical protein
VTLIVAVTPLRSSRIWKVPEKQKVYPNDWPGSKSPLSRKLCAVSRTRARALPVFVKVTRVPAAKLSELGLKGPPPPAIVIVAKFVGVQFGLGLGEGLVPGEGLGDGLGLGLIPGDGLGLGLGVCAILAFAHNPIAAANTKVTNPCLRIFMRRPYRPAISPPKHQRLRN